MGRGGRRFVDIAVQGSHRSERAASGRPVRGVDSGRVAGESARNARSFIVPVPAPARRALAGGRVEEPRTAGADDPETQGRRRCAGLTVAGMLIAIEGVDGAGKRTLCDGLRAAFETNHASVSSLSFPRYGHSVAADVAAEALHGEHGDLSSSVYAMAVLFALDRAGARDEIGHLNSAYDVVILDRYVA